MEDCCEACGVSAEQQIGTAACARKIVSKGQQRPWPRHAPVVKNENPEPRRPVAVHNNDSTARRPAHESAACRTPANHYEVTPQEFVAPPCLTVAVTANAGLSCTRQRNTTAINITQYIPSETSGSADATAGCAGAAPGKLGDV
jgi:hypothetical protein